MGEELLSITAGTADGERGTDVNVTLIGAIVSLVLWVVFGFIVPVGAGWIHLLLALGMALLIRRVVTGPAAR